MTTARILHPDGKPVSISTPSNASAHALKRLLNGKRK